MKLKQRYREILDHSLGGAKRYRNYFATGEGSKDWDDIQALVHMGLMEKQRTDPQIYGDLTFFSVTAAGVALLDDNGEDYPDGPWADGWEQRCGEDEVERARRLV
jgi:hypothetical protein